MKIVVAIDESECSKTVLKSVAHREWNATTTFLLLSVLSAPSEHHLEDIGLSLPVDVRARLRKRQERLLKESASYLREHMPMEIKVSTATAEGHVADEILKVAKDWGADMIVIGSHDYRGLEKFCLGSVAEPVLLNATCSVEIVREKSSRPH